MFRLKISLHWNWQFSDNFWVAYFSQQWIFWTRVSVLLNIFMVFQGIFRPQNGTKEIFCRLQLCITCFNHIPYCSTIYMQLIHLAKPDQKITSIMATEVQPSGANCTTWQCIHQLDFAWPFSPCNPAAADTCVLYFANNHQRNGLQTPSNHISKSSYLSVSLFTRRKQCLGPNILKWDEASFPDDKRSPSVEWAPKHKIPSTFFNLGLGAHSPSMGPLKASMSPSGPGKGPLMHVFLPVVGLFFGLTWQFSFCHGILRLDKDILSPLTGHLRSGKWQDLLCFI